jgi:hypothetical protein
MLWTLNSDNARLIRLFSNPYLLLGPYGQQVRKAWRNSKTKTNMNDAQLKLSSQVCFRSTASRLITKAYKPYLDEMGITYPQYLVLLVLWKTMDFL